MNIVVLSGSPRKGANTDTMVEAFAETAREAGHTVEVIRVAGKRSLVVWDASTALPMRAPVCRRMTWPT